MSTTDAIYFLVGANPVLATFLLSQTLILTFLLIWGRPLWFRRLISAVLGVHSLYYGEVYHGKQDKRHESPSLGLLLRQHFETQVRPRRAVKRKTDRSFTRSNRGGIDAK